MTPLDMSAIPTPVDVPMDEDEYQAARLVHIAQLMAACEPLTRTIVVDEEVGEDGVARGEWVITRRDRTTTGVKLAGVELPGLLARIPMTLIGDPPWGLRFTGWDQLGIARDLILRGLSQWGPGAGRGRVECDVPLATSGVIRDRFYPLEDGNSVLQRVDELSDVIGGFDWWIETNWTTGGDGFKYARRTVRWGYPSAGQFRDLVLDWDPSGNIADLSMEEDGSRLATDAFVYGAGESISKVIGKASSNLLTDLGYPRLAVTRAATSISDQGTADGHAGTMLRWGGSAEAPPTVTMFLGRGITLDDLGRGDRVSLIVAPCPGWPLGWEGWVRILGWSMPDNTTDVINLAITSYADQPGNEVT